MKLFIAVSETMELLEKASLEAEEIYLSEGEAERSLLERYRNEEKP